MQPQTFDGYAQTYDEHFTHSLIGIAQRTQVYNQLLKSISFNQKSVLEINCGTGEDASWLVKQGANVLATDISEGMIDVARNKPTNNSINFKALAAQDISSLAPNTYNIIFSNFGGLNCLNLNEIQKFRNDCTQLQYKSDQLAFVIMSTKCWWERVYFSLKNEKPKSIRRQNNDGVETNINDIHFKTYYYSPSNLKELFKENYNCINVKPIGLFIPPSYLEPYIEKRNRLFGVLKLLDKLCARFSVFSNYADHYLIVFEKK
ncbi:MAG: class I SAM-dependent methyltransferase [Burkholderiales bacterium]|nr:class I SAM-dependent methyltransferase [Bacteroidia bacterium]